MTSSIGASPKSCARVSISRSRVTVLTLIVVVAIQQVYASGYVLSTSLIYWLPGPWRLASAGPFRVPGMTYMIECTLIGTCVGHPRPAGVTQRSARIAA